MAVAVDGPVTDVARLAPARPGADQRSRSRVCQGPAGPGGPGTPGRRLRASSDSLTRALLWGAAWDATRDAEMDAARLHRSVRRRPAPRAARGDVRRGAGVRSRLRRQPIPRAGSARPRPAPAAVGVHSGDERCATRIQPAAGRRPRAGQLRRPGRCGLDDGVAARPIERSRGVAGRCRPALDVAHSARIVRRLRARPISTPNTNETTPHPVRNGRLGPGRRDRTRRPRRGPGTPLSTTHRCPTGSCSRSPAASGDPARNRSPPPMWNGSSPICRPWPRGGTRRSPRRSGGAVFPEYAIDAVDSRDHAGDER